MNAGIRCALGATLAAAFISAAVAKPAGWSLVEKGIVKKIPATFTQHRDGFVASPSDADVQDAIALGTASKEKRELLDYAYIHKEQTNFFATDVIYVRVATPLFLIGAHAREQAREYRAIDQAFVEHARNLNAVRISLTNEFLTDKLRQIALSYEIILLRDGARVEPLREIAAWESGNPFADRSSIFGNSAVVEAMQRTALETMRSSVAGMNDEGKRAMVRQFSAMGWNDAKLCESLGWTAEELARIRGDAAPDPDQPRTIALADSDGVFALEELKKPGRYELVFRRPHMAMFGNIKDHEVRFPISFERFR